MTSTNSVTSTTSSRPRRVSRTGDLRRAGALLVDAAAARVRALEPAPTAYPPLSVVLLTASTLFLHSNCYSIERLYEFYHAPVTTSRHVRTDV
jgi:hypothetical protein